MQAVIFIGSGKISYGKLSQALDYGALTCRSPAISTTPCSACRKSRSAAGHLPGQQRQSVPAGRAEDDHVPRARSAALGSARLDRRARRQPGQLQRLRQGVHRAARARPDRPHAAAGRHQRRRRQHALRALRAAAACAGTAAGPTRAIVDGYYARAGRQRAHGPRRSPAPSRSIGR